MTSQFGIVTPSLNQAPYIRRAIESVLTQKDTPVDYLIVDGGSTDGTVGIVREYGGRVHSIIEPDRGQADALVKGFSRVAGQYLSWLNADDALAPGAIASALRTFQRRPDVGLVYGDGELLDENGRKLGRCPWTRPFDHAHLIHGSDYILQPAAFFSRKAYKAIGGLDSALEYAMDWDLWIRLAGVTNVAYLPEILAYARVSPGTKTARGGLRRVRELSMVASRHAGRRVTTGVAREALYALGRPITNALPTPLNVAAKAIGGRLDHWLVCVFGQLIG